MAGNEILIRWASESSQAVRDMSKVEKALGDAMTAQEKRARRWDTANKVMRAGTIAWTGAVVIAAKKVGDYIKLAQDDAKAQAVLTNTLQRTTGATGAQAQALSDFIDQAARATLFTDDQLRPAMGNLLRATGDQEKSQRLLNIAMDAATATGKDVGSVTAAVGKAYNGNVAALKRLFPFIKDSTVESNNFAEAMRQIERRTKGAADTAAKNSPFEKFQQDLDELKESVGKAFNTEGFQRLIGQIDDSLNDLADFAEEHPDALVNIAKGIGALTAALWGFQAASVAVPAIRNVAKALNLLAGAVGWLTGASVAAVNLSALGFAVETAAQAFASNRWAGNAERSAGALKTFWSALAILGNNPATAPLTALQGLYDFLPGFRAAFIDAAAGVARLLMPLAQATDALHLTHGAADALKKVMAAPITTRIDAANAGALKAVNEAKKALGEVGRQHPKAIIDAANAQAKQAARDATRAVNAVKQDKPVRIDADTSPGRSDVNNFRNWINGLGASVSVGVRVNRTVVTQQVTPSGGSDSSTSSAQSVAPVNNFYINGFGGDPDTVARRVLSAVAASDTRYNATGYAR